MLCWGPGDGVPPKVGASSRAAISKPTAAVPTLKAGVLRINTGKKVEYGSVPRAKRKTSEN
jgi:hypothetical protein